MSIPRRRRRLLASTPLLAVCVLTLMLTSCVAPAANSTASHVSSAHAPTTTAAPANRYVEARLGFSLALPTGWQALSEPGLAGSSTSAAMTLVAPDEATTHELVVVGVLRGPAMPAAFAARGTPSGHIGTYPAYSDNRGPAVARVPCLVRIFLAGTDYVVADWCAMDAAAHSAELEALLATYQPQTPGYASHALQAPAPKSCAQARSQLGYAGATDWGQQLAIPAATAPARGWAALSPGAYVCSNERSPDRYLFQCTELANRYLYEQWALPHLPGTAARYFDYVQHGQRYPGVVRDLPAGSFQLSDDASQGQSAFRPRPGDLLIFQDVRDPHAGWTSGLIDSPGHVAVITAVDATHVYVAQENYNETQYFLALPMASTASGYALTDRSGLPNRIVRGWIHFIANGGPA